MMSFSKNPDHSKNPGLLPKSRVFKNPVPFQKTRVSTPKFIVFPLYKEGSTILHFISKNHGYKHI